MNIVGKALSNLLEPEYVRQRDEAAQELHNALVEVINEQQPSVETALYVLEILKLSVIQKKVQANNAGGTATPSPTGWRGEREKQRVSRMGADSA